MIPDINIFSIGVLLVTLLVSVTLHEAMHAFTANWLGDDTARMEGRLTLNPIKHIDPFLTVLMPFLLFIAGAPPLGAAKPVPFNPYQVRHGEYGAALVGLSGPLTNFLLAAAGALFFQIFAGALILVWAEALLFFIFINLAFFVFNMIPFPPLDGSRVLYAVAPEPIQRIMAQIESFGLMGFLIFFLLGFQYIAPIIRSIITTLMTFLLGA
jgi:Zn-dependent protease